MIQNGMKIITTKMKTNKNFKKYTKYTINGYAYLRKIS